MRKFSDLSGKMFGRLTALRRNGSLGGRPAWLCLCNCGSNCTVMARNLVSGNTKSCGCVKAETAAATGRARASHGMTHSPEYSSNVRLEINGTTRTLAEWARISGVSYGVLHGRLRRGWSPEAAIGGSAHAV